MCSTLCSAVSTIISSIIVRWTGRDVSADQGTLSVASGDTDTTTSGSCKWTRYKALPTTIFYKCSFCCFVYRVVLIYWGYKPVVSTAIAHHRAINYFPLYFINMITPKNVSNKNWKSQWDLYVIMCTHFFDEMFLRICISKMKDYNLLRWLIPRNRVLLEKLIVSQQVYNPPAFHVNRKFITVFTRARPDSGLTGHSACLHEVYSWVVYVLCTRTMRDPISELST
jgi:hypothetical protein